MTASKHPDQRQLSPLRIVAWIVLPVLLAWSLYYLFTEIGRFGTVVGVSMAPTLQVGDYYVLRMDAYNNDRRPERGDVIVYELPDDANYAKRIVAIENDMIAILGGRVFLNGAWLNEPYIMEDTLTREVSTVTVVPENAVFVLGDNRNHSEDSRDYGPVSIDDVVGRVTKIVWPRSRARSLRPVIYE